MLDPSSSLSSFPKAINDSGEIVGYVQLAAQDFDPVIWSGGTYTDLSAQLGNGAIYAVNTSGDFVGYVNNGTLTVPFIDINGSGFSFNWINTQYSATADGVNSLDEIVGYGTEPVPNSVITAIHPFLIVSGTLTDLGLPNGMYNAGASAINDADVICGWAQDTSYKGYGFVYSNGSFTLLPPPIAGANAINESGAITGPAGAGRPYIDDNGTVTTASLPKGGSNGSGQAINNFNVVAGTYDISGSISHGLVWAPDQQLYDLNAVVDASGAGLVLNNILGVNDSGELSARRPIPAQKSRQGCFLL